MQVCDRCKRDIDNKASGAVLHHPDVDQERSPNEGRFKTSDLCPRCYRLFAKYFRSFMASGGKD